VAKILNEMIDQIRPGISTYHLDKLAQKNLKLLNANSAPLMAGFPGNTCISVNEIIAHGVPNKKQLKYGDRINIDVSAEHGGYFSDIGATVIIGESGVESNELLDCARSITQKAINMSVAGTPLNEIAKMIEENARLNDFTVVKNLCSHGVGKSLHAFPENIVNYYDPEETLVLQTGMVIAWEPYISTCAVRAIETDNDWNLTTHNNSDVAQFEHTVLVTDDKPEILTVLE
jgi:methionyl aminopeptidase